METVINQTIHARLTVDNNTEDNSIELWQDYDGESVVINVEREHLPQLIQALQKELSLQKL